ncbi:MAG TPA: GGDEF domain-containing response regulator [Pyrinomonadaceae bacterium]|nr:GGDEF domain-containing response regulator [Pyrinomonadaceae bacterium]
MSTTVRESEKKRPPARDQGRVLLVAEDARVGATAAGLEAGGFFVAATEGGTKALIALQRTRPHVVVADAGLKGISAQELVRMLVEAPESVPVVVAGLDPATVERREAAMSAGASDYFQLPEERPLLLARVGQLAAYKVAMDRLRAEADRDYLTGLANRRRFRKALGQEVERWRRYRMPCSLLMLDVDHLKKINDAHGHTAGDRVIRYVASALTGLSRDNDTAARLGGEEFALLLAGVGGEKAFAAAERLREAVCAGEVDEVGAVSISVGVAACPTHARSERELFAASDAALYRAKRQGRNLSVEAEVLTGAGR